VTNAASIAAEILRRLPRVKSGSLAVFGDVFGGRIDNVHVITAARVTGAPEHLVIDFNEGEALEVWDPVGAVISDREFRIQGASPVRWEWFFYGRPHSSENRYFIEHVRQGEAVVATTDAGWFPASFAPSLERPAVELLGPW
jgi:hypothetical protein